MRASDPFAPAPRTVKPRTNRYVPLPPIYLIGDTVYLPTGENSPAADYDWHNAPPSVVVGRGIPRLVARLDARYGRDPRFQWHASERSLGITQTSQLLQTVVQRFGWRGTSGHNAGANLRGHWHLCICTDTFLTNPTTAPTTLPEIVHFFDQVNRFCEDCDVPLGSTASAIAAQFLRDPRFYPDARRKVPQATNAAAREHLPGNYYELRADITRQYDALEIDQHNAHHYHARTVPMPDANSLFARGSFNGRPIASARRGHTIGLDSETFHDFYGLHYIELDTDTVSQPYKLQGDGRYDRGAFIFSSEVPLLRDVGYRVRFHLAAWGSYRRDTGLPSYARFAEHELATRSECRWWLKPLLLTTYGLLAITPRIPSRVMRTANGPEIELPCGGREWLKGFLVSHTNGRKVEPCIANVIQRGLIESACKVESVGMARYLESHGERVLQIYADSVIIEDNRDDRPLPFLPEPWQAKQPLTRYRPISPVAFISNEKARLPGVSGRERVRLLSAAGNRAPVKPRTEAVTGRQIRRIEQEKRRLPLRHI